MRDDLRAAILAADDLPREPVDVPWDLGGAKLYVRGLTAAEKDRWVSRTMPDGEGFRWVPNLTAELVALTLVDEDGERIFHDTDAPELGQKGAGTIGALFAVAMRLSGLTTAEAEVIEQDFAAGLSSASSTA